MLHVSRFFRHKSTKGVCNEREGRLTRALQRIQDDARDVQEAKQSQNWRNCAVCRDQAHRKGVHVSKGKGNSNANNANRTKQNGPSG